MLERLDYVKLAPRRILDAAQRPAAPRARQALSRRASHRARFRARRCCAPADGSCSGRNPFRVCGDLERLPLAADADRSRLVQHGAALAVGSAARVARVRAACWRPEGLLMFSTLGPDTLKELRAAAGASRVHAFIDMHDLGDMLVAAGFSAPVMDMEMIEIEYARGGLRARRPARQRPDQRARRPAARARGAALRRARCAPSSRRGRRSRWCTATRGRAAGTAPNQSRKPCVFSSACLEAGFRL